MSPGNRLMAWRSSQIAIAAFVVAAFLAPSRGFGDDVAVASPAAVSTEAAQHLDRIFAGGTPSGVSDLKAMQTRVHSLTEQLNVTTVGVQVGTAQGSGVIISKDGYVLTAAHVAGTPNREVIFFTSDGKMLRGKTLGLNRTLDAGLMKITEGSEFPFAVMGSSDGLKEGQWVLATGHPGGYQPDRKPVLRLGRILLSDKVAVTTDCTLVGGDSGGPLFDMKGRVIGINSRISGPLTANMHVPVNAFRDHWQRMDRGEAWGHFPGQEPYIGIRGEPEATEAKISHVFPESPAAKAGLKVGDIVLSIDSDQVKDFSSLTSRIREKQPGDQIRLKVKRGEETIDVRVAIGKRGE